MSVAEAFGDVASNLAALNPDKIVAIKASQTMSFRVELLVNRRKEGTISAEEANELERFLALDLFISLAKARARILLAERCTTEKSATIRCTTCQLPMRILPI